MKIIFLSTIVISIFIMPFYKTNRQNIKINKNQIINQYYANKPSLFGNKTFNEVRIIRSTLITDIFSDVITKYQQKDDPTNCISENKTIAYNRMNLTISKYSL